MVAQQVVDRLVGGGHPDPAEERHPHADDGPRLAQSRQGRERVALERLGGQVDRDGGLSPGDVVVLYPGDALRDDVRVAVRTVAVRGPGR